MHGGGYNSGFEENDVGAKRKSSSRYDDLKKKTKQPYVDHSSKLPSRSSYVDSYEKEEKKSHFAKFLSLNAYERHKKLVHDYIAYYGGKMEDFKRDSTKDKTDFDVIKENHQFIWDENDDSEDSWGKRLAKKYYNKLFKEYCICDLSRYKENKIAMRWRVEKEVVDGKGQFSCGARKCECTEGLKSWEVNFGYLEHGEKKNALVKLRLCSDCSYKLNYNKKHKKSKKKKKKSKKKKVRKHKRKDSSDSSSTDSFSSDEDTPSKGEDVKSTDGVDVKVTETENIWEKPVEVEVEKSREDVFDDYLEDLFM
ncbi:protein FRA10AC1 homolog isoform X2 [Hydractinia symbiolongicarpus]|uniref:protein FRA10AC1 homolog isoform X2 n=1 Tax=Hydractinia symbiolongicarpus TaxID=13093 RepID=UPI00254F450A|nr:protein FRA10AC1 homolog isoform X2 [Hydractinia symbiolongicarpus]